MLNDRAYVCFVMSSCQPSALLDAQLLLFVSDSCAVRWRGSSCLSSRARALWPWGMSHGLTRVVLRGLLFWKQLFPKYCGKRKEREKVEIFLFLVNFSCLICFLSNIRLTVLVCSNVFSMLLQRFYCITHKCTYAFIARSVILIHSRN